MSQRLMTLQGFLDAQEAAQPITTIDDLLATLKAEESGNVCEFEAECYESQGIQAWKKKRGELVQTYRCGWQSTHIGWCPRRKKYLKDIAVSLETK